MKYLFMLISQGPSAQPADFLSTTHDSIESAREQTKSNDHYYREFSGHIILDRDGIKLLIQDLQEALRDNPQGS